ncbi:hypothetical protein [uncultured Dysgonomonas sp.]|nr:hypothetical protein [uncultured Dysgonomonas sp.]
MKKMLFFIMGLIVFSSSHAQEKKFWLDFEVEQTFGLNQWFDNEDINKGLRKNRTTDLKSRINFLISRNIGVYSDLSISLYSYNKDYKSANYLNEFDLNSYYLSSDYFSESDDNPGAKLTIGAFYKFRFKKFDLVPHLGFGLEDLYVPSASYTVKEHNSNAMYNVRYIWLPDDDNFVSDKNIITALQLTSSYKLTNTTSLTLGINYRLRLTKPKFKAVTTDYYDGSVVDEIEIKGKNMHSLGISLGVSFGWGK